VQPKAQGKERSEIMHEIKYQPIGIIRSPFKDIKGMPIQPSGAEGVAGRVEIEPAYIEGLKDIEGFSHIILIYHFHLSKGYSLEVKPFMDNRLHGVFSTRAPKYQTLCPGIRRPKGRANRMALPESESSASHESRRQV
jgi:hypothetical protein